MKKKLMAITAFAALITLVVGSLCLIGIFKTKWNWISVSMALSMICLSIQQFSIKGEPKQVRSSRGWGVFMIFVAALNCYMFIDSILK